MGMGINSRPAGIDPGLAGFVGLEFLFLLGIGVVEI